METLVPVKMESLLFQKNWTPFVIPEDMENTYVALTETGTL